MVQEDAAIRRLEFDLDAVEQLCLLAEVLRLERRARRAVVPERLQALVRERRGRRGHAVRLPHAVLGELERLACDLRVRQQDGVRRVERDVAVEVVERREEKGRAGGVRARVWRVLGLRLVQGLNKSTRRAEGYTYQVVRADVDPRDEVRLRHVLAVEELVEVLEA